MAEAEDFIEIVDPPARPPRRTRKPRRPMPRVAEIQPAVPVSMSNLKAPGLPQNLLTKETVLMTVLAQDPLVVGRDGPVTAAISVPAERMQRGPRGHRFHVVDVQVGTNKPSSPVVLHDGDPWVYRDRWAADVQPDRDALAGDREFRAQNVYAVAAHTLALFEKNLGRPIPWYSGYPQLYLIPQARVEANAFYSREHNAVLFGWLPAIGQLPALYTALSYDIIAHEVTHAILDGLRPRYTEPGLPDQLAFHEAVADLVALFSVFELKGVAQHLLDPNGTGVIRFPSDAKARKIADPNKQQEARIAGRAAELKGTPLARLAEQVGGRRARTGGQSGVSSGRYPALRDSVNLPANDQWKDDPAFAEPHRRAEVLVAAFMQTFVSMWAGRLEELRTVRDAMDAARAAEEGVTAARHLLAMLLRALDYLPPVELEFADVIDSVLTADLRVSPDDDYDYRGSLTAAFAAFGIVPPPHRILDEDAAPADDLQPAEPAQADYPPDPDTTPGMSLRYEHLNLQALRTSPEEIYQFIWNNAANLGIDVRLTTRVERVLASTRVGPDGLVVTEIIADYVQILRTTGGRLPPGIAAPVGLKPVDVVELWGGGVLVFDQFGRFRLHQRQPILDVDRQTRRLKHLVSRGIRDPQGGFGASDGVGDKKRFALLHRGVEDDL